MKPALFLLLGLVMSLENGMAKDAPTEKSRIINIPTDKLPPADAEKVAPTHPFFADSAANELMEKVQELEERIAKLEQKVFPLEQKKTE